MMPSRALFGATTALFILALGVFALIKDPRRRLHQYFSAYCFTVTFWLMPATGFFEAVFGHNGAVMTYRIMQVCIPLSMYFIQGFVQELAGIFDRPSSKLIRRIELIAILAMVPLYPTQLIIVDFTNELIGTDLIFRRIHGPLYLLNYGLYFLFYFAALVSAVRGMSASSGVRRNQMRFVVFALVFGILGSGSSALASLHGRTGWLHFPITMFVHVLLAYAIFKYQLFEFGLWMRRLTIYSGVYLTLAALPLLIFFPFRSYLLDPGNPAFWPMLSLIVIAYGGLATFAPAISSFLKYRAEKKRWDHLNLQLEFMKESTETLSHEGSLSTEEVANRAVAVLKEFYWERLKSPLSFALVTLSSGENFAISTFPMVNVDKNIYRDFQTALAAMPEEALQKPFNANDIETGFLKEFVSPDGPVEAVRNYLVSNQIELCCPCSHGGKLFGSILLGAKPSDIFWPEEISTLQLNASHVAMAARKSELIQYTKELKDLDQMKKEFISNITHEFKSPLIVIESAVQILMSEIQAGSHDQGKALKFLMMIRNNTGKLSGFIQNLLDLARIETARIELKPTTVVVKELLQDVVSLFTPLAQNKGVGLTLEAPESLKIKLDRDKIHQVISNLVSNALKFTSQGKVDISATNGGNTVKISVKDTGAGIDPAYLEAVFEKFFRVPDTANVADGTGLGLAIAKGWVSAHQGKLWAESAGAGKGSTFVIELPVHGS